MQPHVLCNLLLLFPVDNLLDLTNQVDFDNELAHSLVNSKCSVSIQPAEAIAKANPRSAIFVPEGCSVSFPNPLGEAHWFIPESEMKNLLQTTYLQLNSNVFVYNSALEISEIYQIKRGPIHQNKLFQWNDSSACFQSLSTQPYLSRRSKMSGTKIQAVTKSWGDLAHTVPNPQFPHEIEFKGPYHDVFKAIELITNFTVSISPLENDTFGKREPDGQWSGILGKIANHQFDIALPGYNVDLETFDFFETIHILSSKGTAVLNITPIKPSFGYQAYLTVLSFNAWVSILGLVVLTMVWSRLVFGTNFDISTHFNLTLDQLFLQRFNLFKVTEKLSQRQFCLILGLIGPTLFIAYTAMLVSDFRAQPEIHRIETFEDILRFGYQLSLWENANSARILKASTNPALVKLHQDVIYFQDYYETLRILNTTKKIAAFVIEDSFRLPHLHHPDFKEFLYLPGGYVLPLGSEFVDVFSYLVIKVKENGILAFDMAATFEQRISIQDEIVLEAIQVSLHHLYIPFGVLCVGVLMSFLIVVHEVNCESPTQRPNSKSL